MARKALPRKLRFQVLKREGLVLALQDYIEEESEI